MVATPNRLPIKTRVRISKSGQVTLPAKIRERLGVELGEYVEFTEETNGTVSVKPFRILTVDDLAGKFGPRPDNLDEILRDARKFGSVRERYRTGEISDDID